MDVPDTEANSTGAKGIGEPPLIPTAPAIANAVFDAIGVRFRESPLTRAAVLAALAEGRQRRRRGGAHRETVRLRHVPARVDEAVALLDRPGDANGAASALLAGGTDLLTLMKADLVAPEHLIDIKRLADLDDRIEETDRTA